jgi:D-galactarolactone cycloisomerase
MDPTTIRAVEAYCYRFPLTEPVVSSFGRMTNRPALFIRVQDDSDAVGWGEVWCNFPSVGAEHRARLVNEVLAPLLIGVRLESPTDCYSHLAGRTAVLAIQSGEAGPFAQAIAGLDTAVWDLFARRAEKPLWRMLGGKDPTIRVYASGINPTGCLETVDRALSDGHRAFKLKIGFDEAADRANLAALRNKIGELPLAADANQAWDHATAARVGPTLSEFSLEWLEEPLRADTPWSEWRQLAEVGSPPLAAGENIAGQHAFAAALSEEVLAVVQPDLAKWGGITLCSAVAHQILAAGVRFCPHFLGGGIGLLASAHLLAGVGGDGMLEIDMNPNPLRDHCCGPTRRIADGRVTLGEEPGLGVDLDIEGFAKWRSL